MIKVGILTASDKGSAGERIDESGKVIMNALKRIDAKMADYVVVPDDKDTIAANLVRMADIVGVDLILTTGGTGFSPRDITPKLHFPLSTEKLPEFPKLCDKKAFRLLRKRCYQGLLPDCEAKPL